MGILNADHPDIMTFIESKRDGLNLNNFNISVAVTGDFMEKVRTGENYDLINPRTGGKKGSLNAREVFDRIAQMAWETGDPGLIFIDRVNRDNPNPQLGEIESTNPCVTGDTWIHTSQGPRRAIDIHLSGDRPGVVTDGRFGAPVIQQASAVWSSGHRRVFRLTTQEGYETRVTPEHRIMTDDGWVRADELQPGQSIHILNREGGFGNDGSREMGEILGGLIGDGTLKKNLAVLSFFGQKRRLAPAFAGMMDRNVPEPAGPRRNYNIGVAEIEERDESRVSSQRFLRVAAEFGLTPGNKHTVPERVFQGTKDMQAGFLSGLFSADGHVNLPKKMGAGIHLTSISRQMLLDVQRLLINLGIACRIHFDRRPARTTEMPDGRGGKARYNTKAYHELLISRSNLVRFQEQVGFLDGHKRELLDDALESYRKGPRPETFTARFKAMIPDGEEEVFDLTEPVTYSFIANGMCVSNCGEQALLPYESCNLASVNLARMVIYPESGPVEMDWDRLERVVRTTVHMLDNVIDRNNYPIEEIGEMSRSTRRIGLGVMGFSDLLVQMGIPYDSEEGVELARQVMRRVRDLTHAASSELAGRRGNFPTWEGSIYNRAAPAPMRNSAPTTIAPTGTISIIAGASSGIEPLFALSYVRSVMDNTRMVEGNPHFEAVARSLGFHSEELMEELARTGTLEGMDDRFGVPGWVKRVFRTSHDISPEWHVRMQAAFQEHTDNSVSKTINFPREARAEDVARAYLLADETGCKGITVYRDGSKEGQVLSTGRTVENASTNGHRNGAGYQVPRERPAMISGVTERLRTGHGNIYITINRDEENRPFEVFGNLGKAGGCDAAQMEAVSRMVSLALRARIDPEAIIEQLQGITCCPAWYGGVNIRSSPDAVALALRRHMDGQQDGKRAAPLEDGIQMAMLSGRGNRSAGGPPELPARKCPDCNGQVIFQEGCVSCTRCGWNKCE